MCVLCRQSCVACLGGGGFFVLGIISAYDPCSDPLRSISAEVETRMCSTQVCVFGSVLLGFLDVASGCRIWAHCCATGLGYLQRHVYPPPVLLGVRCEGPKTHQEPRHGVSRLLERYIELFVLFGVGGFLLSHNLPVAVPSALAGLASGFGMGPGVSLLL